MRVIVDADACPCGALTVLRRLEKARGFELLTVASFRHEHSGPRHIVTGDEDQAADLAIANRAAAGDIVVTQDWGLAALVMAKGARAIVPDGRIFREDAIGFLLEERALKARYRRGGGRTRGPAPRTTADDRRFEEAFLTLLDGEDGVIGD